MWKGFSSNEKGLIKAKSHYHDWTKKKRIKKQRKKQNVAKNPRVFQFVELTLIESLWIFLNQYHIIIYFEYVTFVEQREMYESSKDPGPTILRTKRIGSLSIVNNLDVLRERILLELARRKALQDQRQIDANRRILDSIGKRSVPSYKDYTSLSRPQTSDRIYDWLGENDSLLGNRHSDQERRVCYLFTFLTNRSPISIYDQLFCDNWNIEKYDRQINFEWILLWIFDVDKHCSPIVLSY